MVSKEPEVVTILTYQCSINDLKGFDRSSSYLSVPGRLSDDGAPLVDRIVVMVRNLGRAATSYQ